MDLLHGRRLWPLRETLDSDFRDQLPVAGPETVLRRSQVNVHCHWLDVTLPGPSRRAGATGATGPTDLKSVLDAAGCPGGNQT